MKRLYNETVVKTWLGTIGIKNYDISSNSSESITVMTDKGAIVISVDAGRVECSHMTVTAVSSFSWNSTTFFPNSFNRILPHVTVHKWGWLYESCSSVLLKTFLDYSSTSIVINGYSIEKLQSSSFVRFVENCCDMQISTRLLQDYTVKRSITFSVPVLNPLLQDTMIKSKEDLFRCLKKD